MFTLEIKKVSQELRLEIADESDIKLFKNLLATVPLTEKPGYFESSKVAFQRVNAKDIGNGRVDQKLIQQAWEVMCEWAEMPDAPIPGVNTKSKQGGKTAPTPQSVVPTVTYDPAVEQDAKIWVDQMKALCLKSATPSTNIDWKLVYTNILHLSAHRNEDGFITRSLQKAAAISLDQVTEAAQRLKTGDGLKNVIDKLSKAVQLAKLTNEVSNFYGAFNEAMDLLVSLTSVGETSRFSVPGKYKKFELTDVPLGGRDDIKALKQQDIDRTEIHNGVKYYIEVKSDVRTAVQKHSPGVEQKSPEFKYKRADDLESDDEKFGTSQQLLRMLAVIQNRAGKTTSKSTAELITRRVPAVSILNSKGWLELFTSGTARVYARLGFHLFIEGIRFTPEKLASICDAVEETVVQWVRDEKGRDWLTLQYKEKKPLRHEYFQTFAAGFDSPTTWASK